MAAPHQEWTVLAHERPYALDDNILTVIGHIKMPAGDLPRRMTAVRLRDGRLVIFSAIALNEEGMSEVEAFGQPEFLVVPNDHHRLDAKSWKDRYPAMKVITPQGSRDKVAKAVPVDMSHVDFGDRDVRFVTVPGTQEKEAALEVSSPSGLTLVLNDIIGNIRDAKGFGGWFLRMMGFAGDEPHVPAPIKAMLVKDKAALAHQLRHWATDHQLKRIIVSHGETIEEDPKAALLKLAAALD
jgi:hypothetical protein